MSDLRAPLQMPTLRIELEGIKQAMVVAITHGQEELHAAIAVQLTACLATLTPDEILIRVRESFDVALYDAVRALAPELVQQAVTEYFTTGVGAGMVREALLTRFGGDRR